MGNIPLHTRAKTKQNRIQVMCLYPKLIKNPKYTANAKNRGVIPPVTDPRVLAVPIGCGNCIECRKQKAREWQVRLIEDIKQNRQAHFITLTFSNESIKQIDAKIPLTYKDKQGNDTPLDGHKRNNEIAIYAVRHFLERWRKKFKTSLRHWLVTELGHNGTHHIHLHGIIWTDKIEALEDRWQYGFVWKGYTVRGERLNYVSTKTINYCVKYVNKIDKDHMYYKSKILCSAGIGANYIPEATFKYCEQQIHLRVHKRTGVRKWYLKTVIKHHKEGYYKSGNWLRNRYDGKNTIESYQTPTGHEIAMPIYWRNKIYTEEQREQLWLNRLDKQERWVCGERVDISKGLEEYFLKIEYHRIRSKQLGYGDDQINWSRVKYETEISNLLLSKRTGKDLPNGNNDIPAQKTTGVIKRLSNNRMQSG